jgi:hypothetical protein
VSPGCLRLFKLLIGAYFSVRVITMGAGIDSLNGDWQVCFCMYLNGP